MSSAWFPSFPYWLLSDWILSKFVNCQKWDRVFWVIAGSIVFLVVWRLGIKIASSRYAAILIYPTITLVVWLFYRVTEMFGKIPGLHRIPEGYYPWISRGLLAGMLIVCLVKDLRFNHYVDFIPETCKIIKADAANYQYPVIWDLGKEARRLQYYSHLESQMVKNSATPKNIEKAIEPYRFLYDVIYVVADEKPGESIVLDGNGKWELISSKFKNNRKRLKFNVYRYIPSPKRRLWRQVGPESWSATELLVSNGEFEKGSIVPIDNLYIRRFQNKGIAFFQKGGFLFPKHWSLIGAPGFEKNCKAEVELSKNAISGEYSLRMAVRRMISVCHEKIYDSQTNELEFLAKGTPGSLFSVAVDAYNSDGGFLGVKTIKKFRLFSPDAYKYDISITLGDVPALSKFRLYFVLEAGEIYLDNVSLGACESD